MQQSVARSAFCFLIASLLASCVQSPHSDPRATRTFQTRGVIKELRTTTVVIAHDKIPGYMDAMTMPFNIKEARSIEGLKVGDKVSFKLVVTSDESWIEDIVRLESGGGREVSTPVPAPATNSPHPLRQYKFTNELGQPVALDDFKGNALAITFFFTRCPIPDYCPRLSKNFQAAQTQLASMAGAPTNWHLLSVTIDPEHDTPPVLKGYGKIYGSNPAHWSFLTGPKDKITELAKLSDVSFDWQGGLLSHNFRTLIIDPAGTLQMAFPIGGDISSGIVEELVKAMTNSPAPVQSAPEK